MIRPEETTGTASETHDASRAPLPASTRIYVEGQIHPSVRVPMREIALSDTKSFNGRIEENEPVRVYDCSGPWGDPAFTGTVRTRPARPAPRVDPRPRRCRGLRRPPGPAAGQRLPHRETRRIRLPSRARQQVRRIPRPHRRAPQAAARRHRHTRSPSSTMPARASSPRKWSSSPSGKTCRSRSRFKSRISRTTSSATTSTNSTPARSDSSIQPSAIPTTPPASSAASRSASPPRSRPSSSAAKSPPAAPSSRANINHPESNR